MSKLLRKPIDLISKKRKLLVSLLLGVLGFTLSPFGIAFQWEQLTINIPWSLLFPVLAAMAYGWKYGVLAGLAGGALFPFYLWPMDGWPNVSTSVVCFILFISVGIISHTVVENRLRIKALRFLLLFTFGFFVYAFYYKYIYTTLLSFNPPFWVDTQFNTIHPDILRGFLFKDTINFLSTIIVANTLLKLPVLRRILGLSVREEMRQNHLIFAATMGTSVFVWLVFVVLGKTLPTEINELGKEHIFLSLFVILSAGFVVSDVLIHKYEKNSLITTKLSQSEKKFRKALEFMPIPIVVASSNGDVLFYNKIFYDTYGYNSEDIPTTEKWFEAAYPDPTYRESLSAEWKKDLAEALKNGEPIASKQLMVTCKNGTTKTVEMSVYLEQEMMVFSVLDISEQKRAEQDLILAKEKAEESDNLKTTFLQNISHEIRTPMNAIWGFTEFLSKPGLTEDKRNGYISIIQSSSKQLLTMVNNILTMSAIHTSQEKIMVEKVCVNTLMEEIQQVFSRKAAAKSLKINVTKHLSETQSNVFADRVKLYQILNNLVGNAIKFTPKGEIEFGCTLISEDLKFYVKDTGIGITKSKQQAIFDRFVQANENIRVEYGGSGLGLSICKGFVDLMGGRIWVDSEPSVGSTFYFTVPYKPVPEDVFDTALSTDDIPNLGKRTVLIAEDQEYNFLFLNEFFSQLNWNVIHVKNGRDAVEKCKENSTLDFVLMDIKMPVMDGLTAAKLIKEFRKNLPIIAQTAYAKEVRNDQSDLFFDAYLTKPISGSALREIILNFVGQEK
jgi:PAS domain S-box-containing protein